MQIPKPELGLVLSYSYLWHHEHRAGRDEGAKNRPCVIVLAIQKTTDGATMVRVAPITHVRPEPNAASHELPAAVKRHLGLDAERSWVILDEINEFIWPGYDLRPVPGAPDRTAFGFLPPRLFDAIIAKLATVWRAGQGRTTPRL